jgi:hypothetical protein
MLRRDSAADNCPWTLRMFGHGDAFFEAATRVGCRCIVSYSRTDGPGGFRSPPATLPTGDEDGARGHDHGIRSIGKVAVVKPCYLPRSFPETWVGIVSRAALSGTILTRTTSRELIVASLYRSLPRARSENDHEVQSGVMSSPFSRHEDGAKLLEGDIPCLHCSCR